ncbi:hypothetical protein [Burkholderia cepacia]|uniref:hypothetical protein n=1 Tax=Burkholderia cepacia TaxID=292 RepID=UPI001589F520|nr:hypothetical protein [Burkholderia cepacia]
MINNLMYVAEEGNLFYEILCIATRLIKRDYIETMNWDDLNSFKEHFHKVLENEGHFISGNIILGAEFCMYSFMESPFYKACRDECISSKNNTQG